MRTIIITLLFIGLTVKTLVGQETFSCRYPIHVSADSLVNFVINEVKMRTHITSTGVTDDTWKKYFYDNTRGIKYDTAFSKCQDYLIKRLGYYVYCNYIDMFLNSFSIYDRGLSLSLGLQIPNLRQPLQYGNTNNQFERIYIVFEFKLESDSSLSIIYPTNVPDCKGLPDCGFVYTKEKAIEIAKNIGFLNDSSKYYIKQDGVNWVIHIAVNEYQGKTIRINIQTGKESAIEKTQRID